MLIVFGVVAAIKRPESFTENAVDIFGFADFFVFTHHDYVRLDKLRFKSSGLSEESLYDLAVILRQHGRDRIPFRREFEQGEIVVVFSQSPFSRVIVDIRKLVLVGVAYQLEIRKRQAMLVVELLLGIRVGRVTV